LIPNVFLNDEPVNGGTWSKESNRKTEA